MGKLRLDLEEIRVDSFDTAAAAEGRGTVQAHQCCCNPCCCTCCNTCAASCNGTCAGQYTCGVNCPSGNTCDQSCWGTCWDNTCWQTCEGQYTCQTLTGFQIICECPV